MSYHHMNAGDSSIPDATHNSHAQKENNPRYKSQAVQQREEKRLSGYTNTRQLIESEQRGGSRRKNVHFG